MCVCGHVPRGSVSVERCTSAPYRFANHTELADEVAEFHENRTGCEARCGNISEWDVSNVESMQVLFDDYDGGVCDGCNEFNGDIKGGSYTILADTHTADALVICRATRTLPQFLSIPFPFRAPKYH